MRIPSSDIHILKLQLAQFGSMDEGMLWELFGVLAREEIMVIKDPETGFVPMPIYDPDARDFYLGEALVTRAEVEYKGRKGYGLAIGDSPAKALASAAADAILPGNDIALRDRLSEIFARAWASMACDEVVKTANPQSREYSAAYVV